MTKVSEVGKIDFDILDDTEISEEMIRNKLVPKTKERKEYIKLLRDHKEWSPKTPIFKLIAHGVKPFYIPVSVVSVDRTYFSLLPVDIFYVELENQGIQKFNTTVKDNLIDYTNKMG